MDADDLISRHLRALLDGLAANPALPAPMVRRLIADRQGFGEVARRPDLTDDLVAEIVATDDEWLLHSLALNERLPGRFRSLLAAHPDASVRSALVRHAASAPREVWERLVDDSDPEVRTSLAESADTPSDLRESLVVDPDPTVRAALAKYWTQAPEEVRRVLLTDPEEQVRSAACSTYYARLPHPVPPADLVPALLADPLTRAGAAVHAVLDADILRRLAADPDSAVRAELARHPDLPPQVRDVLAVDRALAVRVKVFARPDTPEQLRAQIHASVHRDAVSLDDSALDPDPDADDQTIREWLDALNAPTELRTLLLPWVAADPLPHVDSPYVAFRASAAAAGGDLPADVVARLLDDDEELVRLAMANAAPHLVDPATAERIERRHQPRRDKFTSWWDRAQVVVFPPEYLRRFATDADARLRSFAPRDPDLPAELAARLAADPVERVRHAVAPHRNLPLPSLLRLLADPAEHVAEAAAASPHLPVEHMERLLADAGL
ncbi:hypothetical protein ACIQF6_19870 [Kitasatospora sp. NPDC092948]|uniref:hypothetical protein n=1 Tax=Kitasatospora sp. NPDC092948 TaxID=3364088 RepID=UPI003830C498